MPPNLALHFTISRALSSPGLKAMTIQLKWVLLISISSKSYSIPWYSIKFFRGEYPLTAPTPLTVLLSNCLTVLLSRVLPIFTRATNRAMITGTLTQPTLLLDENRCRANIERMWQKTREQAVVLRPHFKTHQSKTIGRWFRDCGTDKITVSSIGMAGYFASDGWNDITIAFPVNIRQVAEIEALSQKVKLGLLVVDAASIDFLGTHLRHEVSIWIKIDVGTHRTGLAPGNIDEIERIIDRLKAYANLHFAGFLAHAGHSYQGRSVTEVQQIYDQSLATLVALKRKYNAVFPDLAISLGDTPGASMVPHFGPVDELRPGNYVFYDLMQYEIGACTLDDIAVVMACPVVAVHPERKQWIIYGGAIHFSKDFLPMPGDRKCFGKMVDSNASSWSVTNVQDNPMLISLSQEHGIVQCDDHNFHQCKPGDITLWLPVHSCLTADAMGAYLTTDGKALDHYRQRLHK
jgi:D-serine deaminase-like pyridoxal phosphate-dependent protein